MRVLLVIIFAIVCLDIYGQDISVNVFLRQKRTTDSLTKLIDTNQTLIEMHIVGIDSIYGGYNGSCLYHPEDKSIRKIECTFLSDSSGIKICYFHKDSLAKLIDKGTAFYFMGDLLWNESGTAAKTSEATNLLIFQSKTREVLKSLIGP